jgi:hypothetical protein
MLSHEKFHVLLPQYLYFLQNNQPADYLSLLHYIQLGHKNFHSIIPLISLHMFIKFFLCHKH